MESEAISGVVMMGADFNEQFEREEESVIRFLTEGKEITQSVCATTTIDMTEGVKQTV